MAAGADLWRSYLRLDPKTVTAQQVFDAVCHMRTTKLPILK